MTGDTMNRGRIVLTMAAAAALMAVGAAVTYVVMRPAGGQSAGPVAAPAAGSAAAAAPSGEVAVALAPEILGRAGITTEPAQAGRRVSALRFPGVVEPNGYRQVVVTAVAAGRMLSVTAELGQDVRRGDELARMHVPELAEAERAYVSMQAEAQAARLQVARVERLVKIGAASQQELESMRATETKYATEVENARARLDLLGLGADQLKGLTSAAAIDPVLVILAPADGTVTKRLVNRGQNVGESAELFTLVDLATVWVVGDVYERDLGLIRMGSPVTVANAALSNAPLRGSISYIDPQVAPGSRTARVRVEVPNRDGRLRLGMYVDLTVDDPSGIDVVLVPKGAVQTIDAITVVYVADEHQPGRFVERSVRTGAEREGQIEVLAGLRVGERVVGTGSFALRSERERRGFGAPAAPAGVPAPVARHRVLVTPAGFSPATVEVPPGVSVDLVFVRTTDDTCATDIVVPALKIRRALPLNQEVVIRVEAPRAGKIAFSCGMDMVRGSIVVK